MTGEFARPPAGGAPNAQPPPAEQKKRSLTALWIILAALVGAGAVILYLMLSGAGAEPGAAGPSDSPAPSAETGAASQTPQPDATTEPTTEPTTAPTTAPPAVGVVFPAACEDLFDQSMLDEMPRYEINPPWVLDPETPPNYGTADDQLKQVIENNKHITCVFAKPSGGGEAGINTNVVQVDVTTAAAVTARLKALGQNCYEELSGVRCVMENKHEEGMYGESHFLRDDIWLATGYGNMGPDGYTHHIIGNIWN
ncbi:hypothetical protein [Homoserinimonas sp. OAct 916]|uniref:hypothetical protein n=1 Tax=Homoserinimonas sp. OAct 916 TaxID=2211450 RepID=UPI000DBE1D63|nr:hypothetical protein [Homoserinimonas sp. OAct 916]